MEIGGQIVVSVTTKLAERILGPSVDLFGKALENWTARGIRNIERILRKAEFNLGDKAKDPGSVPPRILGEVLAQGAVCEDDLSAEYLGGILASSRTPDGKDDRAASFLAITAQLSSFQLRLHYVCYSSWHKRYSINWFRDIQADVIDRMISALTYEYLASNLEIDLSAEHRRPAILFNHAIRGLDRLDLIENFVDGSGLDLNNFAKMNDLEIPPETEFLVRPTTLGGELYLWGTGNGTYVEEISLAKDLPGTNVLDVKGDIVYISLPKDRAIHGAPKFLPKT